MHPEKSDIIANERIVLFFIVNKSETPVLFPAMNPIKEKALILNKSSINVDEYNGITFVKNECPAT
jgi:hypothetical protein